jgi:hypothetical protein
MAAPKLATLALAVLLAATLAAPPAAVRAAMSCTTVYNTLMPCLPFVQMGGAMPPQPCCGGIRSLLQQANNTPDRRAICGCLKNVANSAGGSSTYIDRAAALPSKCGVSLPYKISTSVNCNTYVHTRTVLLSLDIPSSRSRSTTFSAASRRASNIMLLCSGFLTCCNHFPFPRSVAGLTEASVLSAPRARNACRRIIKWC